MRQKSLSKPFATAENFLNIGSVENAGNHQPMKITNYFKTKLGVRFKNTQWSWGAFDEEANRVFLRVWEHEIMNGEDGEWVKVYWKPQRNKSPGYAERLRHIAALRNGAETIGVVLTAVDPHTPAKRKIASFDDTTFLRLADFKEDDRGMYTRVIDRIPATDFDLSELADREQLPTPVEFESFMSGFSEGTLNTVTVTARVRSRCEALRRAARRYYADAQGKLICRVCGWHKPPHVEIAGDIVELHHRKPLATLPEEGISRTAREAIKSLIPLCPCCHRIAHAKAGGRTFTPEELSEFIPRHPPFPIT